MPINSSIALWRCFSWFELWFYKGEFSFSSFLFIFMIFLGLCLSYILWDLDYYVYVYLWFWFVMRNLYSSIYMVMYMFIIVHLISFFFLYMIKVSPHSTSERLIPRWFVGTSKGGTAGLGDLMLLHTQRQGSNPRQLVKGEWVLATQPHTLGYHPILLWLCFQSVFYFYVIIIWFIPDCAFKVFLILMS